MLGWGDLYAHVGLSIYYLQCYLTLHGPSNRLLEAAIGSPFTSVGRCELLDSSTLFLG